MAPEECLHGLVPEHCAICKHGPMTMELDPPVVPISSVFGAHYDSHCRGCNLPISTGQPIRRFSDGSYRHKGCE